MFAGIVGFWLSVFKSSVGLLVKTSHGTLSVLAHMVRPLLQILETDLIHIWYKLECVVHACGALLSLCVHVLDRTEPRFMTCSPRITTTCSTATLSNSCLYVLISVSSIVYLRVVCEFYAVCASLRAFSPEYGAWKEISLSTEFEKPGHCFQCSVDLTPLNLCFACLVLFFALSFFLSNLNAYSMT